MATVFTVSHVVMRGEDRIVLGIADTFGKQNCNSKQNMFLKIMHFQENDIFSPTESVADGDTTRDSVFVIFAPLM